MKSYTSVLFLLHILRVCQSLTNVELSVPAAIRAGDNMTMSCTFTLGQEHLYSVKFYLGDTEFYRYLPEESPQTRIFNLPDVSINLQGFSKNSSTVSLSPMHRDMTGFYKCEVSADAPLFHTDIKSSFVVVAEEPEAAPKITVKKMTYTLGDSVEANCTCRGGYPPANLTWFANSKQVAGTMRRYLLEGEVDSYILQMQLLISPSLSRWGSLRLRCVASQFSLYYTAAELVIQEESSNLISVSTDQSSLHNDSMRSSSSTVAPYLLIWLLILFRLLL